MISLRAGYKFGYPEESYSIGMGLNACQDYPIAFDFSYGDYGRLGNIIRMSLQLGIL